MTEWITLSQKSIRLVIRAQISLDLRTPNVFMRTTWAKTKGLSKFQVLTITHRHYASRMAMNRHPTTSEGVAYQLDNYASIWCQQLFQIASSVTPPSRCALSL